MVKFNFTIKVISLYLCFFVIGLSAYGQSDNNYYRFLDSADVYIDFDSKKTLSFLDSISKPFEESISGRISEYYYLKSLIHDDFKEYTKNHQCVIMTLKYADKEQKYCKAAQACLDLFTNLYFLDKKVSAFKYIDKAEAYYEKCDFPYGKIEVDQARAYVKFVDGEHEKCNDFLLERLGEYRNINDDAYYYLFGLYMLTSNYIYSEDINKAYKYYKEFKTLKDDTTIVKYNYLSFKAGIATCFAEKYLDDKIIDSTIFYLKESSKLTDFMAVDAIKSYYQLNADTYKYLGELETSKLYIDSLMLVQNKVFNNSIEASFQINDSLLEAESELISENKEQKFKSVLYGVLIIILLLICLLFFVFYRKQKDKAEIYSEENNNLSYLKSNTEQLAVKVHGLEEYIKNLKKEVKQISRIECINIQKEKIKELYRNLHVNSSTLLDKSENHLELVNELNICFFTQIGKKYPQLNKSEVIICYYLFMGFINKEIAVFLNVTVRSIESRRYRISKKIDIVNKDTTLLEYLQTSFSNT